MSKLIITIVGMLCAANFFVWGGVVGGGPPEESELYFLDVGQGDAELVRTERAVYMIDGGKNDLAANALGDILPFLRRRIDVLFISHPQQDHLGGLFDVIRRYGVGAVVWNGERNELWSSFSAELAARGIPVFAVSAGDIVRQEKNVFRVVWPPAGSAPSDQNDQSLVLFFSNGATTALYAGDVTEKVERALGAVASSTIDVLKVAHHGSKYSSSMGFLETLRPLVAVIEVGKNSYGHPTQEVLARLADVGARTFRTDQSGTVRIVRGYDGLRVSGAHQE